MAKITKKQKALAGKVDVQEIDRLIESIPDVGLRLNVPASAVRLEPTDPTGFDEAAASRHKALA